MDVGQRVCLSLAEGAYRAIEYQMYGDGGALTTTNLEEAILVVCGAVQVNYPDVNDDTKYYYFEHPDAEGAHIYDKTLPMFSDLHYVGPRYGYWMKMNEEGGELLLRIRRLFKYQLWRFGNFGAKRNMSTRF